MAPRAVRINRTVAVPFDELRFGFSTSGGPGGQHANRSATKVELVWNPESSRALGPRQKDRVLRALSRRIDSSGNLRLSSDRYRSQLRNRADVTERFTALIRNALVPPKSRIGTTPTRRAQEKRLKAKRQRAELKRARARRGLDDDR